MPLDKRNPLERSRERGAPLIKRYFTADISSSVKRLQIGTDIRFIITGDELFKGISIDDLKRSLFSKKNFGNFFCNFGRRHTFKK